MYHILRRFRHCAFPVLLSTLLILGISFNGCSTNPATGKSHLNLVGEQQEIAMGQQANRDIVASMGLYPIQACRSMSGALASNLRPLRSARICHGNTR